MTLTEIKRILCLRGLAPSKRFGQNFLYDQNLCRWIVDSLEASPDSEILEIGPGLGAITQPLLEAGFRVHALEIDRGFAAFLREHYQDQSQFQLSEGDAMELLKELPQAPSLIIGNLPYNISTPLIMTLMGLHPTPARMLFTLQLEAVERLAAVPGTKAYSSVSVLTQAQYEVKLLKKLPSNVFYPRPEVTSAVVRLDLKPRCPDPIILKRLASVVRQGFSNKRKMLTNLLPLELLHAAGVPPRARAEELSVDVWLKMANTGVQSMIL